MAGSTGTGGLPAGCDPVKLLTVTYNCSVAGVCHDAKGSAAGMSMLQADWPKLVNKLPVAGKPPMMPNGTASICAGDPMYKNTPYIIKGSPSGDGLLMQKLAAAICLPGGGQMPTIPGPITVAADMACIKAWATQLANAP